MARQTTKPNGTRPTSSVISDEELKAVLKEISAYLKGQGPLYKTDPKTGAVTECWLESTDILCL